MPFVRINACGATPLLHGSNRAPEQALARESATDGPVIVMIHGYKYRPGVPRHCPHLTILAAHAGGMARHSPGWPRQLGFGTGHAGEGLGIALGWNGRGSLRTAQRSALSAGQALAQVVRILHRQRPDRPVHLLAHSLGVEVALEALHHLPTGAIGRIVALTGAAYRSRATAALATPAGRSAELVNVTSRENDPLDFLFERLTPAPMSGDAPMGRGLDAPNAVTLQLDCPSTLAHLARLGAPIGSPERRICHWSSYTRTGVLRFYNDLMRRPGQWPLPLLRHGLPDQPAPRWSRLLAPPAPIPGWGRLAAR